MFAHHTMRLLTLVYVCAWLASCNTKTNEHASSEQKATAKKSTDDRAHAPKNMLAKALARVGKRTITVGDFVAALNDMSPYIRARYRSPERRRELLESMIDFELLVQEAEKRGIAQQPEVERYKRHLMIEQMLKEQVDAKLSESQFTEAQVRAFYESHRKEFNKPEEVRANHILLASESEARNIITQLKAHPADLDWFEDVARQKSLDTATKPLGGDLNFFPENPVKDAHKAIPKEVIKAAFSLKNPGDLYPDPVHSQAGYHVIMLARRREPLARTLPEATRMIRNRLLRDERERQIDALVVRLKQRYPVQENKKALDLLYAQSARKQP